MSGEQILIVDNDHMTANVIRLYLENLGFVVPDIAYSGVEAIKKAKKLMCDLDLILIDTRLGKGLDGIDAAGVIMKKFKIPIIYATAYNDEDTLERAQMSNPYGFINKPLREVDLKTTIKFALNKNKNNLKIKEPPLLDDVLRKTYNLSRAESRIISRLLDNPDTKVTAEALHISIATVRTHLKHIYQKTETTSLPTLLHMLFENRLYFK